MWTVDLNHLSLDAGGQSVNYGTGDNVHCSNLRTKILFVVLKAVPVT